MNDVGTRLRSVLWSFVVAARSFTGGSFKEMKLLWLLFIYMSRFYRAKVQ